MDFLPVILFILFAVGALFALGIFVSLCYVAFVGAVALFMLAAEQGFIGLAAYVACWVFLSPLMLIICIIIGFFHLWASREDKTVARP